MEKSQGGQAVTPVSIPPDPYQRALKDMRLAREELREANERIKRLEEGGGLALGYASKGDFESADEVWLKAKEAKP
jgi:diaminopimelate decarboxylase